MTLVCLGGCVQTSIALFIGNKWCSGILLNFSTCSESPNVREGSLGSIIDTIYIGNLQSKSSSYWNSMVFFKRKWSGSGQKLTLRVSQSSCKQETPYSGSIAYTYKQPQARNKAASCLKQWVSAVMFTVVWHQADRYANKQHHHKKHHLNFPVSKTP